MPTAQPSRFLRALAALLPLALAPLALLAACRATPSTSHASVTQLVGAWTIERIDEAPLAAATDAHLVFEADGRLHGHAGVNRLSGTWTLDAGDLALSQLVTTRMAGPPERMQDEQRLLTALQHVRTAEVDEAGRLVLRSDEGAPLVRAARRSAEPAPATR